MKKSTNTLICTHPLLATQYFYNYILDADIELDVQNQTVGDLLNYIKHPINNAVAEWLNGKIQEIKTIGRRFIYEENWQIPAIS